jgi:hypothetical protein
MPTENQLKYYETLRGKGKVCGKPFQKGHKLGNGKELISSLLDKRFRNYRHNAKKRGLIFELTLRDVICLSQQKCAYCGEEGFGIDRLNSDEGYTKDNVVPCCRVCNKMKMDLYVDNFLEQCKKIYRYTEGF